MAELLTHWLAGLLTRTLRKRSSLLLLLLLLSSLSILHVANSYHSFGAKSDMTQDSEEDSDAVLTAEVMADIFSRLEEGVGTVETPCRRMVQLGGNLICNCTGDNKTCINDGAKYVCMDEDVRPVPGRCVALNFGIGFDFSFDKALVSFGCRVFASDPTNINMTDRVQRATIPGSLAPSGRSSRDHRGEFMALDIGIHHKNDVMRLNIVDNRFNHNDNVASYLTLGSVMEVLDITRVDIIKMDVEGAEWKVLRQILNSPEAGRLLRGVRQILLEIHLDFLSDTSDMARLDNEAFVTLEILRQLHNHGFYIAAYERNDVSQHYFEFMGVTIALYRELTFIRRDVHT